MHLATFLLLFALSYSNGEEFLVETKYGTIRGFPTTIDDDGNGQKTVKTFLDIPFAQPPINELRFEKPLPPSRWNGVRNATEMGPACFPYHRKAMWAENSAYSEDCLYMNILAPNWKSTDGKPFPVLVYIHGGGFQTGTIRGLDSEVLAKKYVQKGIVFVALQYRLAHFGFAATGDENFAGNYGLWDQKLALEYVQENIAKFGGDPKHVTALGFSAGSASVSALGISTQSGHLFHQAIQMSGSFFADWASGNRSIEETREMAKELGCDGLEDSALLKKCLKEKSVPELMEAVDRICASRSGTNELLFPPRLDSDFFSDDPMHLISESPPKRTLMGLSQSECLSFTMFDVEKSVASFFVPEEKRANFGRNEFEAFIGHIMALENKVKKKVVDFYLSESGDDSAYYLRKYTELCTDVLFLLPALKEATAKSSKGWPVFLYQIDYFNRKYFPQNIPVKGSSHGVELPALVDVRFYPYKIEEYGKEDLEFANVLLTAIINFIKTGDPSSATLKWPALSPEHPLQYAQLNPNPTIKSALAPEKLQFWQNLSDEFSFDIVRGTKKMDEKSKDEL